MSGTQLNSYIPFSKRPDILPNMQLEIYKQWSETVLYTVLEKATKQQFYSCILQRTNVKIVKMYFRQKIIKYDVTGYPVSGRIGNPAGYPVSGFQISRIPGRLDLLQISIRCIYTVHNSDGLKVKFFITTFAVFF